MKSNKKLTPNKKLKIIFLEIEEILTNPNNFNHHNSPRGQAINKLSVAKKIARKNKLQINEALTWQKINQLKEKIDTSLPKCQHPGPSPASCLKNSCFSREYQENKIIIPNYYKI